MIKHAHRLAFWLGLLVGPACGAGAFEAESLPLVGCHPGGVSYWNSATFANAMHHAGNWMEYSEGEWGTTIASWNTAQFDGNGYPRYLNTGKSLRCVVYGLHNPENENLCLGQYVLTWKGDADVRFPGTFVAGKSNCPSTGRYRDGRRVYVLGSYGASTLTVNEINAADPVTEIKLWLPDPADPGSSSLEDRLWHPLFLARVADTNWGVIRMMDLLDTNTNPQQDWTDRRPPAHVFMSGVLNPRPPASGFSGNCSSGIAYEHMVDLCNATGNDLWVCVPHMATDDFVTRLAQLIRYGSNGSVPYTNTVPDPVYPPLHTNLRVFIEYSNEIWSQGDSFAQGNWAYSQAVSLGITKEQFNARRFCELWSIFQRVFGGTERLVRVASVWTASESYTGPFLNEMKTYGQTLSPATEPDVLAATTYFGNGIQDWVHQKAQDQAGTGDPWFYTGDTFGSPARPVSLAADAPYWTGPALERHIEEAFAEWTRRLLSGDAREGGGPDAVGVGGGFEPWLHDQAQILFDSPKPILAYEGGPSIYTDYMDGGDSRDDGITLFMNAMNRRAPMRDVYRIHLNMARSKGLWMHMPFTLCGRWGKYGQWGHLEYSAQNPADSPKYRFILEWLDEVSSLQHVDRAVGAVPRFETAHYLSPARVGTMYSAEIVTGGGDGDRDVALIGSRLVDGLTVELNAEDPGRASIAGVPTAPGVNYVYLRVTDRDGDPAWRTFVVPAVGGAGTVVESDFTGVSPARNLPWTNALAQAPRVIFSGWRAGAGILPSDGDNAIVYGVNAPSDEAAATLALAVADDEYLEFTVAAPGGYVLDLRGAEVRFGIRRIDYHAPRRYAVFTGVAGFTAGAELFDSQRNNDTSDQLFSFPLPGTAAYAALSGPVTFRIYGYSGQWGGHRTSLIDFKLTADTPYPVRRPYTDGDGDGLDDDWEIAHFGSTNAVLGEASDDYDGDGMSNGDEHIAGTDPAERSSALKLGAAVPLPGGCCLISWQSVSGALYRIESRADLVTGYPWGSIVGGIQASPPINVHTTAIDTQAGFFRIVLESAP